MEVKTFSMTNPKCQKCPKNEECKNKTLVACCYIDNEMTDCVVPVMRDIKKEDLIKTINDAIYKDDFNIGKVMSCGTSKY